MTTFSSPGPLNQPSPGSAGPDNLLAELGTVTLSRVDPADVQQRQVYANIDDGSVQTLLFGDAVTLTVKPGTHKLKANNTLFWKSTTFSLQAGEHVEFALVNRPSRFSLGFLALFGLGLLTLTIERKQIGQ